MRARVAHVVPTDEIAYRLLLARLTRLREAGFGVDVICGKKAFSEELADAGLQVVHIPFARELAPLTDLRCIRALRRALRRGRYDIAHSHTPKGTLLGPLAARLAGVPAVVHTVHGFLFNENTTGMHRALAIGAERWGAAWCHHLLFQSVEDHTWAMQRRLKIPERLHLVGNGIDERRFDRDHYPGARQDKRRELGLDEEHLVVGMVGRLVREKGFEEFFAMAGHIARELPEARFLVVGITETDQSDAVDPGALMAAHRIEDRCIVLERRSDMPELYLSMDAAVLPSHREGIPRALLEAAAMGVPIAASDIRGCREVIEPHRTGLLFPLRDVDRFTDTVRLMLGEPELRQRLGEAARDHVLTEYTEALTSTRLISCYDAILKDLNR